MRGASPKGSSARVWGLCGLLLGASALLAPQGAQAKVPVISAGRVTRERPVRRQVVVNRILADPVSGWKESPRPRQKAKALMFG